MYKQIRRIELKYTIGGKKKETILDYNMSIRGNIGALSGHIGALRRQRKKLGHTPMLLI